MQKNNYDEILISEVIGKFKIIVLSKLKLCISLLLISIILGVFEFKFSDVEYLAESNIIVDGIDHSSANLGISSLIGGGAINENNKVDLLGPRMFNTIISSQAFLNDLVLSSIPREIIGKDSITLDEYFNSIPKSTFEKFVQIPNNRSLKNDNIKSKFIYNSISSNYILNQNLPPIVSLSDSRSYSISELKKRIKFTLVDNNGHLSVKMPEPFLSAIVTRLVLYKLLEYVKIYKTKIYLDNIVYLEQKYSDAEMGYKKALNAYSNFKDKNIGSIFESTRESEQLLSNNLSISFNIYNQVSMKLEQERMTLKKESPIFINLEPISIPESPIEPNIYKILLRNLGICLFFISVIILSEFIFNKYES